MLLDMSDHRAGLKDSLHGLKAELQTADSDTRYDFAFVVGGLALMATAIIVQFGWVGLLFCSGFLLWVAGNHGLSGNHFKIPGR